MSNSTDRIQIRPTGAAAGAQIAGIDLSRPLDDDAFARIERALDEHGVIFFRDQDITPRQQIAFSRRFGELESNFNSDAFGLGNTPEIFVVSNIEENGHPIGVKRVGATWHSDMCYVECPPRATMLHAIEVPVLDGLHLGDTEFANAAAAWDALPPDLARRISDKRAVFDFRGRKRGRPIDEETARRYPPVEHPIVREHPRTGRKSLYVMQDDCTAIVGMDDSEARALITALATHILRPEFIYRHQWRAGDVLIWDNCTVQHRAIIDYDLPQRRLMHRTTICGRASS